MYQHSYNRGSRRERERKWPERIFEEIITEIFPNMGKETLTQVEEAQRIPYKINPRKNAARHILIEPTKIKFKEKILFSHKREATDHI